MTRRPKAVVAAGSGDAGGERRSSRRPKAVVAMSGGVDSSVAAALLVEQGYDVTGIMLKLWRGEAANTGSGCCNVGAATDARRVADTLGIPFYVFNLAERFEASVIRDFHDEYAAGRTPNPCVRCNAWIKFDVLLERALALGAEVLATGHYARTTREGGRWRLLRGADERKDQSYVLWMLSQRQLQHLRFPVGGMTKPETRALAEELGLRTASKPDSQEICFVRAGELSAHLQDRLPQASVPGVLEDPAGRPLGTHRGIAHYTVGQRKGLGLSLGEPVYVTGIDAERNRVVVGSRSQLAVSELETQESSFVDRRLRTDDVVLLQHRAHGPVAPARVRAVGPRSVTLCFDNPVEAVAPGQSAVFYSAAEPQELLGGGYVASTKGARTVA
ncbi:MAG TPA: tRNA 2-thiouridine(34) synthase MnmA [Actinomycetota bacterium]|nr:tRNA 2-thiouridine(34) synthase MnmA [Actinomycetota bacterium]